MKRKRCISKRVAACSYQHSSFSSNSISLVRRRLEELDLTHIACAIDEASTEDQFAFCWICSHFGSSESIALCFDYRSHEQAEMLGYPLNMMAATEAPDAQRPEQATLLRIATGTCDPSLAPWLCWVLAGAPNLAVCELHIPHIPPGLPLMPNLAHLVLRAKQLRPADVQSALQALPNLQTLLLSREWVHDTSDDASRLACHFVAPASLKSLCLECICPASLTLPEQCMLHLTGMLRDLNAMFGAADWKLRGGCLKSVDAWGHCRKGLAFHYPHLVANLGTVELLQLQESPWNDTSWPADDWTLGYLPEEATSCITTLAVSAQQLVVTVPSWPALRHVKLDGRMSMMLEFEDAAASAAALETFEMSRDDEKHCPGLLRFQRKLEAFGRQLTPRGVGWYTLGEGNDEGAIDASVVCICGCCTQCLAAAGVLADGCPVQDIVPLRKDDPVSERGGCEEEEDQSCDEGDHEEMEEEYSDESGDEYEDSEDELDEVMLLVGIWFIRHMQHQRMIRQAAVLAALLCSQNFNSCAFASLIGIVRRLQSGAY
ncbi:hypothetical protein COCOBI_06-6870 [Coccomyxa sp. Obi]|nr:hypothetical protein COCOBI_06-6870 [Coccomyxa sp. Obi]